MTDSAPLALGRAQTPFSARSKMLDVYASEIAEMLTEGRHEKAEREALTIPHIAVALADAALQSSSEGYRDWCGRWVQPDYGAAVYQEWYGRSSEGENGGQGIPFAALRALRLGRRAREVSVSFAQTNSSPASKAHGITCALLGAAFRWYEQEGRHQPIVQTNLARLGVLR